MRRRDSRGRFLPASKLDLTAKRRSCYAAIAACCGFLAGLGCLALLLT